MEKPQQNPRKKKECFFEDTSNYFSLLNLKMIAIRNGDIKSVWEGEREKYIKFLKRVIEAMPVNETYLRNILSKMMRNHSLDQMLEGNSIYRPNPYERTEDFTVYQNRKTFEEKYWNSGKPLHGVLVNELEGIYICIQQKKNGGPIRLVKAMFMDDEGRKKMNLWYAPLYFYWDEPKSIFEVDSREVLNSIVCDAVIIHPMPTYDDGYKKEKGHTVICKSWMVRNEIGKIDRFRLDIGEFSKD